jgi:NADH-quinone oxidoreductase subunit L
VIAEVFGSLLFGVPVLLGLVGLLLPAGDGGRAPRRRAAALGIAGAAVAFADAVFLLLVATDPVEFGVQVVQFGDLSITFGVSLGPAAIYVALAVTVVALFVQIYSVGYLHDDPRYAPYAAQVSLFTGAMLLVVASNDLIMLLVGWEVMGVCSYLLIGHDRRLPEAPRAAVKAFLVTRVGDVGFLLGIALLGVSAGSFEISAVLASSPAHLTAALLLILAGVAGKSAQFPLHTWLPDAMAGPTPISALIHAATMVAAGVYVVTQLFPLFEQAPAALTVLAVMAAITMLLGALAAMAQADIKRVLAWSTVSQLGYMTGALAVKAPGTAMFHLLTHAAFKALLFLAAGAVIHAIGSNLIERAGGLRGPMRATFAATTIGLAALAGLPPFAGFWSKEAVLAAAVHEGTGAAWLVYLAGAATVAITGWYATRLWLSVFLGRPRTQEAEHAREPGPAMLYPVLLLAVPAALLGFAGLAGGFVDRLGPGTEEVGHLSAALVVPVGLALAGAAVAALMWRRGAPSGASAPAPWAVPAHDLLADAFHLDAVQAALVSRPTTALARVVRRADEAGVDGAVVGTGVAAVRSGSVLAWVHRAALPRAAGAALAGAVLLGVAAAVLEWIR